MDCPLEVPLPLTISYTEQAKRGPESGAASPEFDAYELLNGGFREMSVFVVGGWIFEALLIDYRRCSSAYVEILVGQLRNSQASASGA